MSEISTFLLLFLWLHLGLTAGDAGCICLGDEVTVSCQMFADGMDLRRIGCKTATTRLLWQSATCPTKIRVIATKIFEHFIYILLSICLGISAVN